MLASGDYDLMKPFFTMYANMLLLRKDVVKATYQHEGAAFGEIMFFFGLARQSGSYTTYY